MAEIKKYIELGLKCPKCRGTSIRGCGLGDTIFAEYDHFVCGDCDLRWAFAHRMRNPENEEELIARINDKFIWVLHEMKLDIVGR